jgi:hypothetical protein
MPIELITKSHGDDISAIFASGKKTIHVISPFLGRKTCEELARVVSSKKLECKMITRFYREDFIQSVSSLPGLAALLDVGVTIQALVGLHTKLYTVDDYFSIVTSANYTMGGLYGNYELGVKVENEPEINRACEEYFQQLWSQIEIFNLANGNRANITKEMIAAEQEIINKATSSRTRSTDNLNNFKQGAIIERTTSPDLIETALGKRPTGTEKAQLGGWLKFEADAQHRHNPDQSYLESTNVYTRNKTFFPTKPVGIKASHRLFLALVSFDKDHVATPVIIGRAFSGGYTEDNVVSGRFPGWESWMNDYPYYVELNEIELIKGPARNGISLLDVYRTIRGDIYPSTFGTEVSFEKIRQYHYQKDKIRITDFAEDYLNKELEKKFAEFGIEDVWNYKE